MRVLLAGDVMLGESYYAMGSGVRSSLARYGAGFLDERMSDYIRGHDAAVCNVECVLSDVGRGGGNSLRRGQLRGDPVGAEYLRRWGFTVANVANNHILEHGVAAAADTVERLAGQGVRTIGCGASGEFGRGVEVVKLEKDGVRVAMIGFCMKREKYAFDGGAGLEEVIEEVRKLAEQGQHVLVTVHWGDEYVDRPSCMQQGAARKLVKAGAVVVAGHHSHVVQGLAKVRDAVVAYGMGNFIFGGVLSDTRWGMVLSVELGAEGVKDYEVRFVEKDDEHRPWFVGGARERQLRKEFERRCGLVDDERRTEYEREYERVLRQVSSRARLGIRMGVLRGLGRTKAVYWPQVLLRPVQRRIGRW